MKVTVDTNFLISSTQWENSVSRRLLNMMIEKDVEIYITDFVIEEFSRVLKRDFKYNEDDVERFIEIVLSFVKLVVTKNEVNLIKDDPSDNRIIECALESKSDYILTYDKHLLKIKEYKGIKIIKPEEFLKII